VSRVVDLPRAPTDREWEQLVALCRTTFSTRGRVSTTGGLREWSQGNLHICVEPTQRGEQLRLSTLKGDGAALNAVGLGLGAMSVLMSASVAATGQPQKALFFLGVFGGLSLAVFAANLVRLPRWERERQMEEIAEHAARLLSGS
jgi:hypothetical protein